MKKREEIDETTTIADMSMFQRKRFSFPKNITDDKGEPLRGSNLWAFIRGTMAAALLVGLIYALVIGLFILLLYVAFSHINS